MRPLKRKHRFYYSFMPRNILSKVRGISENESPITARIRGKSRLRDFKQVILGVSDELGRAHTARRTPWNFGTWGPRDANFIYSTGTLLPGHGFNLGSR